MKKLIVLIGVLTMLVITTACGSEESTETEDLTLSDPNGSILIENIEVEDIEVEDIQIEGCQDPEYLRELEYNSRENVYHGDWDNVTSWDNVTTETW